MENGAKYDWNDVGDFIMRVASIGLLEAKNRGKNRLANVNFSPESELNEMSV